jgi:uncharacterized protein YerC
MRSMNLIVTLSRRFALAGDATRLSVICAPMRQKGSCVPELADETGESVATVSRHLRMLTETDRHIRRGEIIRDLSKRK